jgi:hypothetical protein
MGDVEAALEEYRDVREALERAVLPQSQEATVPGLAPVRSRVGSGGGVMLEGDGRPLHDAVVRTAAPEEVGAWLDRIRPARPALEVGELAVADR